MTKQTTIVVNGALRVNGTKFKSAQNFCCPLNAYSTLSKKSSRWHFETFFLLFPKKQDLSPMETLCIRRQFARNARTCFLGKIRKMSPICLFVLRFYSPVNPTGSCWAWSVYRTIPILGRLRPLSGLPVLCAFLCQKLTTALLESAERK